LGKLRIITLCSSTSWGGTEKWALRASEVLHKRGYAVTLICRDTSLFSSRSTDNLPMEELPLRNDSDLRSVFALAGKLKKSADVVLLTRVRDYWLGGLAARIAGVPVILRLGVVRHLRQNYIMDRLRYGIFPNVILVNAEAIRETLSQTRWIKKENIYVIYNGVDTPGALDETKRTTIREQLGIPGDEILIVSTGRLAVEKRWHWLIDAVAALVEKGYSVTARLLGKGSESEKLLERISEKELSSRFILPGERHDSHLWQAAADIVALPSSNEGISNSMIESMGMGVPVVATESGGLKEHFTDGDNILYSSTDDFEGFSERLENLVVNENLRDKIGKRGLDTVSKHFTWKSMTDSLEELINKVCRGSL